MELAHRVVNKVDILKLKGRLDASTAPNLQREIQGLFSNGRYRLVLDISELEYVSSPGLRVLIDARKRAREWKISELERGDVRISGMPQRIREVFDLTGFTSLFEIYDDLIDAVGSF
jgi:anti-sigma B factor antagonist